MIIKRIRKNATRRKRSLGEIRAIVKVLSAYVLNASADPLLASDGENALARYVLDTQILSGHAVEPGEKVHRHGTRCLAGNELSQHQRQMIAASLLAPGARDPLEHYLISWKSHERPSLKQIEETLDIFSEEMGYQHCQTIWATHSNTANYHLHLVVNRVDLVRQRVVSPGDGWEIDRLHQVAALVEDAQGWESEPNAIYAAEGGQVRERATGKIMRRADGSRAGCDTRRIVPPERWCSSENAAVAEALRSACSWQDLHNRLAKLDAAYRTKGSGAQIAINGELIKASSFGREFSYDAMTERLGDYAPDPLRECDPYEKYLAALREERRRVREAWNQALAELRERRKRLKKKVIAEESGYKALIAAARLELAFDLAEAEVKKAFDRARATIAETKLQREQWYKAGQPAPNKARLPEFIFAPNALRDHAIARDHGLTGRTYDLAVEYRRNDGSLAVTDIGVVLIVHQIERNAVAASLAMASTRSDRILVKGSQEFLDLCRDVAQARGYALVLENGEILHNPAIELRKTATLSVGRGPTGSPGTTPKVDRKDLKGTARSGIADKATKAAASRLPAHLPGHQAPASGRDRDDLSDEVLWAAINGTAKQSDR